MKELNPNAVEMKTLFPFRMSYILTGFILIHWRKYNISLKKKILKTQIISHSSSSPFPPI